jgi:hypothetical protein
MSPARCMYSIRNLATSWIMSGCIISLSLLAIRFAGSTLGNGDGSHIGPGSHLSGVSASRSKVLVRSIAGPMPFPGPRRMFAL